MSGEHGKSILTLPKFKVCKKIKINLLKIDNHQINKLRQLLNNSNVVINDSKNTDHNETSQNDQHYFSFVTFKRNPLKIELLCS